MLKWFLVALLCAFALAQEGPGSSGQGSSSQTGATSPSDNALPKPPKSRHKGELSPSERLDINVATKAQLAALPGIGDKIAQRIIEGRPYKSKRELMTRGLISPATYDDIKGQIIAHRPGTGTKKKKPADDLRVPQ